MNSKDEAYEELLKEKDSNVLVALLWSWLDNLQVPVLREQEIIVLKNSSYVNNDGEKVFMWSELDRVSFLHSFN